MKVAEWLFDPLVQIKDNFLSDIKGLLSVKEEPREPQYPEAKEKEKKIKIFRPQDFEGYIGQYKAKNILKSYITAMKQREYTMPHVLIHGKAGCGKTTLARIIANELEVKFKETITAGFDTMWFDAYVTEVDGGIIFLDEIHGLQREQAERLYTIMEDFIYDGNPIQRFTLIGATTELGEILRDRRPFYDRFKIIIELEDYTYEDLTQIAKQYKQHTFPQEVVPHEIYNIIGRNCRGTPRTAIRLIEATIYLNNNIKQVLNNFSIIKDGYTEKDLRVLKYIAQNVKGVGLQGLSSYLGTSTENYTYEIEPYLLTTGLVLRTPRGRKITEEGSKKIKELEKASLEYRKE